MEISKLLIPEVDSQYSIGGLPCFGVLIPPEMKDENHEREAGIFWTKQLAILPCIAPLVAALKTLPQLRELTLRKGRENLNLGYKKNHEAALGQTRGELAAAACADCLKQNGPFAECVVVANRFVGACCNCHYSSQGHRCSLRHFGMLDSHVTSVWTGVLTMSGRTFFKYNPARFIKAESPEVIETDSTTSQSTRRLRHSKLETTHCCAESS